MLVHGSSGYRVTDVILVARFLQTVYIAMQCY